MPFPEDLLEQALHLARREPKKPKQASLRRAVSTAYYALFHLLIAEAVRNWRRPNERNTLSRMFDHSVMRKASASRQKELGARLETAQVPASPQTVEEHLLLIASTFVRMQQYRHEADYDNGRRWTRTETLAKIDSVSGAFRSLKRVRAEEATQNYLVSLLLRER